MTTQDERTVTGWVPASTFGSRLAHIRIAMGWSNMKLAARETGIDPESWRNWEQRGRLPHDLASVAQVISQATGCDMYWLMTGSSPVAGGTGSPAGIRTLWGPAIVGLPGACSSTDRASDYGSEVRHLLPFPRAG